MAEPTRMYISDARKACKAQYDAMLVALDKALAEANPELKLKGVVAEYTDPKHALKTRDTELGQRPLDTDWQFGWPVLIATKHETPEAAALRIAGIAEKKKSRSCDSIRK